MLRGVGNMMKKEIERLSNELCQARMQSKFDMIKKQIRHGELNYVAETTIQN
jgi:hypothetical protein